MRFHSREVEGQVVNTGPSLPRLQGGLRVTGVCITQCLLPPLNSLTLDSLKVAVAYTLKGL